MFSAFISTALVALVFLAAPVTPYGGVGEKACGEGEELDGALCYPKCKEGYVGNSFVCWQSCGGFGRDDGAFCVKPKSYGRGAGRSVNCGWRGCSNSCPSSKDKWGLRCYPKCREGYKSFGCCVCTPKCPSGMTDIGVSCAKKSYTRTAGKIPGSCDDGLLKDVFNHRCYNVPRRSGQPCYADTDNRRMCGPQLYCKTGVHECRSLPANQDIVSPGSSVLHSGSDDIDIIFVGDPQYGYKTAKAYSGDNENFYDSKKSDKSGNLGSWHEKKQVDSINRRLQNNSKTNWAGTIVVGDLVNVPETVTGKMKNAQFSKYKDSWKHLDGILWPMVGNHDNENYLNYERSEEWEDGKPASAAAARRVSGQNSGTDAIFQYLFDTLGDESHQPYVSSFDMKKSSVQHDIAYAHKIKWNVGSAAYAFNAGNIKFVQLQNRPDFTAVFRNYRGPDAYSEIYSQESSIEYFIEQVDEAEKEGKRVVISTHEPYMLYNTYKTNAKFAAAVDSGVVVAAFAGHLHQRLGEYLKMGRVPIIMTGSVQYGTYTHVSFKKDSFSYQVVDHTGDKDVECVTRKVWDTENSHWKTYQCSGTYTYPALWSSHRFF